MTSLKMSYERPKDTLREMAQNNRTAWTSLTNNPLHLSVLKGAWKTRLYSLVFRLKQHFKHGTSSTSEKGFLALLCPTVPSNLSRNLSVTKREHVHLLLKPFNNVSSLSQICLWCLVTRSPQELARKHKQIWVQYELIWLRQNIPTGLQAVCVTQIHERYRGERVFICSKYFPTSHACCKMCRERTRCITYPKQLDLQPLELCQKRAETDVTDVSVSNNGMCCTLA